MSESVRTPLLRQWMSHQLQSSVEMSMAPYMSTFSRNGKVRKKYEKKYEMGIWKKYKYEKSMNLKFGKYKVRKKYDISTILGGSPPKSYFLCTFFVLCIFRI